MFQEAKQLNLAIEYYQYALNLEQNRPATHTSLASAFEELGERDKSLHHYWLAIDLDPFHLETHLAIKKLRWAEGMTKTFTIRFFIFAKNFRLQPKPILIWQARYSSPVIQSKPNLILKRL